MPVSSQTEIGIVLYAGAQQTCVHGLTDLFAVAANETLDQQQNRCRLRVTHWEAAHSHDANL